MGCSNSNQHSDPVTIKKQEFIVDSQNFVTEKMGKITKDYQLLNPPLGKGYYYLIKIIGGFGEVRKAIHRETGLQRAVKIISKDMQSVEDQ